MRTEELYNILNACETPTKTKNILSDLKETNKDKAECVADYLKFMLDPNITYGIKKINIPDEHLYKENSCYVNELLQEINQISEDKGRFLYQILKHSTVKEQELIKYAIKRKHPNKIGIKVVNSVFPGLIFQVPYMGALPGTPDRISKINWDAGVAVQPKMDGMAVLAVIDKYGAKLYTRQHKDITHAFPRLTRSLFDRYLVTTMSDNLIYYLHMEFLVKNPFDILPRKTANGMLNKIIKGSKHESDYFITPCLLDCNIIYYGMELPQLDRYKFLSKTFSGYFDIVKQTVVYDEKDAMNIHDDYIRKGYEGTIWKDTKAVWQEGKHTNLLKIKPEVELELEVIDINEHKERPGEIGSLVCTSADGFVRVAVSGLTDEERKHPWGEFTNKIVTVRANELIKSKSKSTYSLLNPRFIEIRDDKQETDSFDDIKQAFNNVGKKVN